MSRVIAVVVATVMLAAGLFVGLWILVAPAFALAPPESPGEGCCAWSDEVRSAAIALAFLAADLVFLTAAAALAHHGFTGRRLRARRLALAPVAGTALFAVPLAITLLGDRDDWRNRPVACSTFRFRAAEWRSDDADDRLHAAEGAATCRTFAGRSRSEVVRALGEPDAERGRDVDYRLDREQPPSLLRFVIRRDRVGETAFEPATTAD